MNSLIFVSIEIIMILCFIFLNCICWTIFLLWGKFQLIIVNDLFSALLALVCWYFGEVIYIYFHSGFVIQNCSFLFRKQVLCVPPTPCSILVSNTRAWYMLAGALTLCFLVTPTTFRFHFVVCLSLSVVLFCFEKSFADTVSPETLNLLPNALSYSDIRWYWPPGMHLEELFLNFLGHITKTMDFDCSLNQQSCWFWNFLWLETKLLLQFYCLMLFRWSFLFLHNSVCVFVWIC